MKISSHFNKSMDTSVENSFEFNLTNAYIYLGIVLFKTREII